MSEETAEIIRETNEITQETNEITQEINEITQETNEKLLEARIDELEKKMFGLQGKPKDDVIPESSILDKIELANSLISSALSGREKLSSLIERLPELEEYAKADFEPMDQQRIDMKLEYILTMEPEIRKNAEQLKKLKDLVPVIDSKSFNDLPEMTEKLTNLSLQYMELGDQANRVDEATKDIVARYNDIITNISKTLIHMDAEVTALEKAMEPKKLAE